jgi:hypothetical protein
MTEMHPLNRSCPYFFPYAQRPPTTSLDFRTSLPKACALCSAPAPARFLASRARQWLPPRNTLLFPRACAPCSAPAPARFLASRARQRLPPRYHTFVPGAFALLTVQALYTVMRLHPPFALPLCHSERSEESPDDRLALLSLAVQVKRCQLPTHEILRSSSASALNDRACAPCSAPAPARFLASRARQWLPPRTTLLSPGLSPS